MSRSLSDIHPKAKSVFYEFLARCVEAQLLVLIVETGRTQERQNELWAIGRTDGKPASQQVTWTKDSKHIMKPETDMKSLAMDVCLYEIYTSAPGGDKLDWNTDHPGWDAIGAIGQGCGLKWGVIENGKRKDKGHFEYIGPLA